VKHCHKNSPVNDLYALLKCSNESFESDGISDEAGRPRNCWQNRSMSELGRHYLETVIREFEAMKRQAERALEQVSDAQLNVMLDPESNSLAVVVKHIAGNMRSRWTDLFTSDGEKPDRDRDSEFLGTLTRAELMEVWERGWATLFAAIRPLTPEDLMRTVTTRGKAHSVLKGIAVQQTHYATHVGQIVFLAKHLAGSAWTTLSVPRAQRPG
jgi:hypothetical protein